MDLTAHIPACKKNDGSMTLSRWREQRKEARERKLAS
jgi:hypothetical protein